MAHSMVVGVERGEERILNPISDMRLETGDVVWIVEIPVGLRPFSA